MERINKSVARKLFNEGTKVTFCPSKMYPGGMWNVGIPLSCESGMDFEGAIASFKFYNCNRECGLGVTFYI